MLVCFVCKHKHASLASVDFWKSCCGKSFQPVWFYFKNTVVRGCVRVAGGPSFRYDD